MIVSTKGIVLRATKYGESSLIVNILTRECGLKGYIQNGVRKAKSVGKANYFSVGSILNLEVYNRENKSLERIKDISFDCVYDKVLTDMVRSGVLFFMIELLSVCCEEGHIDYDLFDFVEASLLELDNCENVPADLPIWFMLEMSGYLGFKPIPMQSESEKYFSLSDGFFLSQESLNTLDSNISSEINQFIEIQKNELGFSSKSKSQREDILDALELYFGYHISTYRKLKCRSILKEIFSK